MRYAVNLDEELVITNIYDLPDNRPVGHIFSFKFADGSVAHTQCDDCNMPLPCEDCLFRSHSTCPEDPDAGECLCFVYDCVFKELDKIMENL